MSFINSIKTTLKNKIPLILMFSILQNIMWFYLDGSSIEAKSETHNIDLFFAISNNLIFGIALWLLINPNLEKNQNVLMYLLISLTSINIFLNLDMNYYLIILEMIIPIFLLISRFNFFKLRSTSSMFLIFTIASIIPEIMYQEAINFYLPLNFFAYSLIIFLSYLLFFNFYFSNNKKHVLILTNVPAILIILIVLINNINLMTIIPILIILWFIYQIDVKKIIPLKGNISYIALMQLVLIISISLTGKILFI